MKCQSCGANLQIDNAFCPYCGAANPVAKKHREDMKRYANDYKKTKEEVVGNTRKFNKRTFRITAIAVTIAAIAGVILFSAVAESAGRQMYRDHRRQNAEKYFEEVISLIEDCDYIKLDTLARAKGVKSTNDKSMREYYSAENLATEYSYVFSDIMRNLTDESLSQSELTTVGSEVYRFYKYYNAGPETENETVVRFFENCKRDMGLLLTTYVGISEDDAGNLENMSEGQIQVLIEEAYNGTSK
ncbi:MAG: zinc ribbon domain-containing protein [Lachnospiraceae bacterium]|nr:zinc ribbon domain-containing protein [Lachnospiraceae bacterium]